MNIIHINLRVLSRVSNGTEQKGTERRTVSRGTERDPVPSESGVPFFIYFSNSRPGHSIFFTNIFYYLNWLPV
jgi:hypothetical protein